MSDPVQTTTGRVRGLVRYGVNQFYGVPYAGSTAGSNRFMPPVKPASWTGIRDCFEVGERAPQDEDGPISEVYSLDRREPMGEDCLKINIYTPGLGNGRRPVMVWLHGGGFAGGSGNWLLYDGTNLARKEDVVVVGVNHRLNLFGFLYLADLGGEKWANSSNVGMQDIVAALSWIKQNISVFGGDPGNVTIFGQSGGAAKVTTLMAMPSAKGLFHRAIAQSGSAFRGITRATATKAAGEFLARLGLKSSQLDELQKMPWLQLREAFEKRPGISNTDVWLIMNSDNTRRANAQQLAELKVAQGKAADYQYYFTWRSPVHKGQMKSFHTLDIPFVFYNLDIAASMTGAANERYALAHKMSAAWAAFARTGNPNHPDLPNWPAFTLKDRATMIFNNESKVVNDPNREERLALKAIRETS